MTKDYFIFGGVDSRDFDIEVFWDNSQDFASGREVERVPVPGRDGDLFMANTRMPNLPHVYNCVMYKDYKKLALFRDALTAVDYVSRLEDTFHPDEYYKAMFHADFEPKTTPDRTMVKFTVEFDRKPQRYLKSGEKTMVLTSSATIYNPTRHGAKPNIFILGAGTASIAGCTITTTAAETDIDCENGLIYTGEEIDGSTTRFSTLDFPVLQPGRNIITVGSGITRIDLTPNWYML